MDSRGVGRDSADGECMDGVDTWQAELASSCGDSFEIQVAPVGIPVAAAVWVEWMELLQAAGGFTGLFSCLSRRLRTPSPPAPRPRCCDHPSCPPAFSASSCLFYCGVRGTQ